MMPGLSPQAVPVPKDLERHFVEQPLPELFRHIDENMFCHRFLGIKGSQPEKRREAMAQLSVLRDEIVERELIKARGVYRFFQANSYGDTLSVFGPEGAPVSFSFPRQADGGRLCLADFALPLSSGSKDYIALMAVTCGEGVLQFARREREAGHYVRSYLIEAVALTLAEAFADVLHYRIRQDWGIAEESPAVPLLRSKYRGKRYSFGYPACPDLANQGPLFNLLRPEADAGVKLTDGYMMDPEASVSAIVFHNPNAVYFGV